MSLNTVAEFKAVLQVGNIYADALLQDILDAADNIVLGLVTKNQYAAVAHQRLSNVNTIWVDRPHDFYVGQTLNMANCGSQFNGSHAVTEVSEYSFSFTQTPSQSDYVKHSIVPSGTVTAEQYIDYADVPEVCAAAMAVASDIFMTRQNTIGQQGIDFQPAPYKLGRGLAQRVMGLLGKWVDVRGMVG